MTTVEFNNRLINMEERLERFALSLTANREEAKDLLQETYLKALSSKDKFIEFWDAYKKKRSRKRDSKNYGKNLQGYFASCTDICLS